MCVKNLDEVVRESLTEEILFKLKSEGNKKVYHLNLWGKSIPGR